MKTVILSGGNGSRLFPLSRSNNPKQYIKFNEKSLFQLTIERNQEVSNQILVISNVLQKDLALSQNKDNDITSYLWEETGRNSAAPIIMSALLSELDEIILVVPADQLIEDLNEYKLAVRNAINFAESNNIVAIGIEAKSPETGFGYIHHNNSDILKFVEKPNLEKAKEFLAEGNYSWNAGIYCFKASSLIELCEIHCPDLLNSCKAAILEIKDDVIPTNAMNRIEDISIDYALMSKLTDRFKVVELSSDWDDMGSFDSIEKIYEKNSNDAKLVEINSNNNLIIPGERIVATYGVDDLIIVDTQDVLMITKRGKSQGVKEIVNKIKKNNPNIILSSNTVVRPWGEYKIIENELEYKTKKITVTPGKRLSLQSHFHRSEHWIVVSGTAIVTVGEKEFILNKNESTYIPSGTKHRLENPGKIPLVIIEAQVGEYLEEDDIVRYEDDFSRG